jgi:hypothetical protein
MNLVEHIDGLIEATASVDAEFRKKAAKAWERVVHRVKSVSDPSDFSALKTSNLIGARGQKIPGRAVKVRTDFGDIFVVLVAKGNGAGIAIHKGVPVMSLPVLIGDDDPKFLETRILSAKSQFIHEFTHFLDIQRGVPSIGSERLRRGGSWTDYAIAPDEFNAFYQEGASEVESYFSSKRTKMLGSVSVSNRAEVLDTFWEKLLLPALASYKAFEKYAIPKFDKDWVEAIYSDSKYKRKFQKRLYGLYQYIKKEYGE